MQNNIGTDVDALTTIIGCLKSLSREEQQRTLQAVATFLDISLVTPHIRKSNEVSLETPEPATSPHAYSEDRTISAKDFLREKSPHSDVERVTCLAYYLTHYREVLHFKTLDISTLNTEAAQPKFSNASVAVDNAAKAGYLVQATKGNKQISAVGEHYVQLLPDREAAKSSVKSARTRKKRKVSASRPIKSKSAQ